jgi:hypothetical protein
VPRRAGTAAGAAGAALGRPVHIGLPGPEALAELAATIRQARPDGPFDLVTELPPDADLGPWQRAGLTWAVTDFGVQPTEASARAVIEAGPGR